MSGWKKGSGRLKRAVEFSSIALIVLICLCLAMIASCGKKGDPVSKQQIKIKAIADLRGDITKDGVLLIWTLPEKNKDKNVVKVLRAETVLGEECAGCPKTFILLTENDKEKLLKDTNDQDKCQYLDRAIQSGRSYSYRIVWCISSGPCSSESNTLEIKIK